MTFAVVTAQRAHRALAAALLPVAIHDIVDANDRVYIMYRARRGDDVAFIDATDGELLIALSYFGSEPEARSWIAADIALRFTPTRGVQ